jgi:hypothetical protein
MWDATALSPDPQQRVRHINFLVEMQNADDRRARALGIAAELPTFPERSLSGDRW